MRIQFEDVRVVGVWRFVQRDQDGKEYAFNGENREIVPHERLVYTFEFEGIARSCTDQNDYL